MKRTFLRILPLAVAVLLATSCSKDDNNTNEVVNNGQENVQTKTLPISITVNQKGLSKLSSANVTGEALQPIFETSDKLAIYNGGTFLTDLVIKEGSISQGGKSATFEGEITAEGIVDGTELTAKIGTPLTDAITATSREDAVRKGCYQISAPFVYSKDGNSIALEEQNAYIEVVWTNKGNATVEFTVNDSKTVSLTLNDEGQGWIVVPAGKSFTCAALGITEAKTTVKGNIYGITREFSAVPDGYVDLGIVVDGKSVYFEKSTSYPTSAWTDISDKTTLPSLEEWIALAEQCYWVWSSSDNGMYVFKAKEGFSNQNGTPASDFGSYDKDNDPCIFLPVLSGYSFVLGFYWSGTQDEGDADHSYCLYFDSGNVDPENYLGGVSTGYLVLTVRRSN